MPLRREKRIWSTIFYSRITLVLVLALCVALAMSVYERYTIEREMAERRSEAEAELAELKARKQELEKKVEYLSADHGIEAEIRQHFDVAREGERVVVIVDNETQAAAAAHTAATTTTEESFWSRLLPW